MDTINGDIQSGGFGLIQNKTFKRWAGGVAVTKYIGDNEFKGGFDYMSETADVVKRESGGQLVTIFPGANPSAPVYQHFYWTTVDATVENAPTSALVTDPQHKTYSFYVQDTWTPMPNLTVNLGLRYDNQQIYDREGVRQVNLTDSWAPRVGFTWDPTRDNKTKVFGSFGYFYEQIPMDLVIRSYSSERQAVIYNYDPTSTVPDPNAAADCCSNSDPNSVGRGGKILGTLNDLTDAGLKGQYLREGIFGFEREVLPNVAFGARYVYRDLPQVVEDFLCLSDGTYCVGNPGQDRMKYLYSLDYSSQFLAPKAQRYYRAFQFDVTKRFSDNWTLLASYVNATLKGNYDGTFAPYTQPRGTADPNISALYDYYDFFTKGPVTGGVPYPVTANGYLSNDRRSVAKLSGLYVTPFNLSVGLTTYYQTGTPISRIGYSGAYSRYEYFLDAARNRRARRLELRRRPAPGLSAAAGAREPELPGGRLQPAQHAARHRRRPAVQPVRVRRPQLHLRE